MNDKDDPQKSLDFARRQLKGGIDDLDADTREKLLQLRHRAMESSLEGENRFPDWATLPIIAFVTAVIFISLVYIKPNPAPPINEFYEDWEILLANDPLEFYENLEFLQKWKEESIAREKESN
ncbi:MAG: hypothetical protein H8E42_07855 [Nitrospinae bacterium]|nr:hypothetical protein [Nitrospinota bacterium]MBL7019162.1 hypothetical protein [Nitrospinaceae bacterium]